MTVRLVCGDSRFVLSMEPDNSVDSVVTDPPYALESVVKRFGGDGAAPAKGYGKTGAYQRASSGFMGQKWDTGETAFDPLFWVEVMRVLKPGGHVLAFSGSRTYHRLASAIDDAGLEIRDQIMWLYGSGFPKSHDAGDGWGTALKPAHEPIVVARKPLVGTVAKNMEAWGVGAVNIDGCRVGTEIAGCGGGAAGGNTWNENNSGLCKSGEARPVVGRWPANVIHDGSAEVLEGFPHSKSGAPGVRRKPHETGSMAGRLGLTGDVETGYGDEGSAARFFYCAKASKADRNQGATNSHPTVKPTDLMRYLCRLVTPPNGIVLDPFMGSGSTGRGAVLEGFRFFGIEMSEDYMAIAKARIDAAKPELEGLFD